MSFILNALRKSEQERQHKQEHPGLGASNSAFIPYKIVNRIPYWAIVLMLVNLAGMSYLVLQPSAMLQDKPPQLAIKPIYPGLGAEPSFEEPKRQAPLQLEPVLPVAVVKTSESLAKLEKLSTSHPVVPPSNIKLRTEAKKAPTKSEQTPDPQKNLKVLEASSSNKPQQVNQQLSAVAEVREVPPPVTPLTPTARNYPKPHEPEDAERLLPSMANLSEALKAQLPPLNINVFAYAETAQERFLIINMRKFKIGDTIKDGLILRDISTENAVLEFNGQRFRIERP